MTAPAYRTLPPPALRKILAVVAHIHRPMTTGTVTYCSEDGQPWPCDTHRVLDPDAAAKNWLRWRQLAVSRAVPPCRECGEPARRLPNSNGAALRHKPGCQSRHAVELRACNWRDRAAMWVRDLFD